MHYDTTSKESTDPDESPTNQRPTLYVCRAADDCYATYGSPSARSEHEASDHTEGGA